MGFSHSICFSNTNSTHTYLCLLSAALRQGIRSRREEYWFSGRKRFLFCFRDKTVGRVSKYPADVKYGVDCKSMIGGYENY